MWKELTEDERDLWVKLAKTIWRIDNKDNLPDKSVEGAVQAAWKESKQDALRKVIQIKKRLDKEGITLVAK